MLYVTLLHNFMTKEQLINYIKISFIDDDKKRGLIDALKEGVVMVDVQGIFEDFLTEKINAYGDQYEKATVDFDSLAVELDKEINLQESTLDKALDEKLAAVNRTDYDARNKIWDDYYTEIGKLDSGYEKNLKAIISKIIVNA